MSRIDEYVTYLGPLCQKHGVPIEMVRAFIEIELEKSGMRRRHNLFTQLREVVEKYVDKEEDPDDLGLL